MNWIEIILIASGLAMDACAVCVGIGASGLSKGRRAAFRLSFHFGLFQFFMPIIGWYLGASIAPYIESIDHWIAFILLSYVGTHMIWESLAHDEERTLRKDPSRGWSLVMLSLATSIDALAVGFSLGMLEVTIWAPSVAIGIITAGLSVMGLTAGEKLGTRFGKIMEVLGGVVLNMIGLRILIIHIAG